MLPLPGGSRSSRPDAAGNLGLYFNKFYDRWGDAAKQPLQKFIGPPAEEGGVKARWISDHFDGVQCGGAGAGGFDALEAACRRIADMARALNGERQSEAVRSFVTTAPFVTGMGLAHPLENGFLWHHTLSVPYLPGSSIKGMLRAWARLWQDGARSAEIDRLFGRDDKHEDKAAAGKLIVFDALPMSPVTLMPEVMTPHDGGWRINDKVSPSDWVSPTPIPFLAVAPGASFQFAFALRAGAAEGDLELAFQYLEDALEWIGAGAKTAVGFGRFKDPKSMQEEEEAELRDWKRSLKDGDTATYFGQRVRLREIDHAEGKVGLVNIEKNKSLGRKPIDKLTP